MRGSSTGSISIRVATSDDWEQVAQLLETSAPGHAMRDPRVLAWHYARDAFGPSAGLVALDDNGFFVGHCGYVRTPLRLGAQRVGGGVMGNLAVHPSQQGRGVARRLVEAIHSHAKQEGLDALTSFTNDQSTSILLTSGWRRVGDPRIWMTPVRGAAWTRGPRALTRTLPPLATGLASRSRRAGLPPVTCEISRDIADDIAETAAWTGASCGIERSGEWWRWRYEGHPDHPHWFITARRDGVLVGAAAASLRPGPVGQVVQLLELSARDIESLRDLVRTAGVLARDLEAPFVVAGAMPGSVDARVLRSTGMLRLPRRLQPRPIHLLVAELSPSVTGAFEPEASWSFFLGDQEHL